MVLHGSPVNGLNSSACVTLAAAGSVVQGLVINGRWRTGVLVAGPGATGNLIRGNYLGTDPTGTTLIGDDPSGIRNVTLFAIRIESAGNTVGGAGPGDRNVIGAPVELFGPAATGNTFAGNYIGLTAAGDALPTRADMIPGFATLQIAYGASGNIIGGTEPGARNYFGFPDGRSGETTGGVLLFEGASGNLIRGNYFGVDVTGARALVESPLGVTTAVTVRAGAAGNVIGGTEPGAGNLIAGVLFGVRVDADDTVVQGNLIGTDATGTRDLGETRYGIDVQGGANTRIGGPDAGARNVIAGCWIAAVGIHGGDGAVVEGNYLGLDATGLAVPGVQAVYGVEVGDGSGSVIRNNVIVGDNPVIIANSRGNTVAGNRIGTDALGGPVGDPPAYGVFLFGEASGNVIGGTAPGDGNLIGFYQVGGVVIGDSLTDLSVANTVLGNRYRGGSGPPIDLGLDGVTANGITRVGPNRLENHPVIESAVTDETATRVTGTLNSRPDKPYKIQLYAEFPAGAFTDLVLVGEFDVTTDAGGAAAFTFAVAPLAVRTVVRATATDETSEFSPGRTVSRAGSLTVGGTPDGRGLVFTPDISTGQFADSPAAALSPFGTVPAVTRGATGDVNGDGVPDTVLVTGPGVPIRVAVVSGADNSTLLVAPFDPFGGDFLGGGYVAAADLDGDGRAEFVVTPDQGGGPRVSVFGLNPDGSTAARANFLGIDDPNFRGGARVALGDVNADGAPDVVVAAGFGGGPRTAVFTGQSVLAGAPARLVADFFAFPGADAQNLRNGSFVAAGDVTGDGYADLVFGGGPGGAPRVFILSGAMISAGDVAGAQAAPVANFFVGGDLDDRGGARVGVTNSDGDGRVDVAVGRGAGRPARVRVYLGKDLAGGGEPAAFQDLTPFGGAVLADGGYVG